MIVYLLSALIDLDFKDLVLVVFSTFSDILVEEGSHVNLSPQESLGGISGLRVRHGCFLIKQGHDILLRVRAARLACSGLGN